MQHRPPIDDVVDPFQGAGAHNPVLHPAIGTLDLALGLRRQGVDHLDPQELHDLLPLGIGLVGLQHMLAPQAVPPLDEAENAQGVDVACPGGLGQGIATGFRTIP